MIYFLEEKGVSFLKKKNVNGLDTCKIVDGEKKCKPRIDFFY